MITVPSHVALTFGASTPELFRPDGSVDVAALEAALMAEFGGRKFAKDPGPCEDLRPPGVYSSKDVFAWLDAHGIEPYGFAVDAGRILLARSPRRKGQRMREETYAKYDPMAPPFQVDPAKAEFYRTHAYDVLSDGWVPLADYVLAPLKDITEAIDKLKPYRGEFEQGSILLPQLVEKYIELRQLVDSQQRAPTSPEERAELLATVERMRQANGSPLSEAVKLRAELEQLMGGKITGDVLVYALSVAVLNEKLLQHRKPLLDLFECPAHGTGCIPDAIAEVKRLREAGPPGEDRQRANALADELTRVSATLREVRADRDELRDKIERIERKRT